MDIGVTPGIDIGVDVGLDLNRDIFVIPLTPSNQTFQIHLSNVHYRITSRWNEWMERWVFDFDDVVTNTRLLYGVPIVTGCNLLGAYEYLGFIGGLVAYVEGSEEPPSYDELGVLGNVYYLTPQEATD